MNEKKKHRFPQSGDYVMTEATTGGYYIAYHLDYWTGTFDRRPDRLRPRHHHDGGDRGSQ